MVRIGSISVTDPEKVSNVSNCIIWFCLLALSQQQLHIFKCKVKAYLLQHSEGAFYYSSAAATQMV